MKNIFAACIIATVSFATIVPADAFVGVGPGRRGVGVGRPGAYGVGGFGRVGRPGALGVGGGLVGNPVVRPTPFRPFRGPVIR